MGRLEDERAEEARGEARLTTAERARPGWQSNPGPTYVAPTHTHAGALPMTQPPERPSDLGPPAAWQRWLAELKRRRVFRVMAVYGAVSFVVLEVSDVVFPAIPLPAWTISLVFWMVLLGFPFAVVLAWAFELTPEGVRRTESATPDEIQSIVAEPAARRWSPGLMALAGMALLAAGFYGGRTTATPSGDDPALPNGGAVATGDTRPAIAVLPFADMSPSRDQAYFSDGISEEILTVLSRIRDLKVAARSSSFTYQGEGVDLRTVGDELGVPYLLAGSIRKDGDQLRITAELVSASDGLRLWSQTYDRRLESVFAIQTEIAEAITQALRIPLGLSPEALAPRTLDMEAHDLYLSARAAMRGRGSGGRGSGAAVRGIGCPGLLLGSCLGRVGGSECALPTVRRGAGGVDGLDRLGPELGDG